MRLVEREIEILAPAPAVYAWLSEPERFADWIGAQPGAVIEPEAGGRLWWRHQNGDACAGYFVELAPYSKLAFTYGWEREDVGIPPGSSLVEITLEDIGGRTILRLVHTGLSDAAGLAHEAGWTHYLGRLALAAAGGTPGPDTLASS